LKIITDTSIIISVLVNESHKLKIVEKTKHAEIIAPASLHWEIGNAFSAMFKRNRITIDQATDALAFYYKIPIRFVDINLESAIKIASQLDIYAYDAYFIVCAQQQKASLLTLDKKLAEASKKMGVTLIEV